MKIPLFTSKSRQLTFAATVTIHSLDQVPMLSGTFYAKLKLSRTNTSWPTVNAANTSASSTALDTLSPVPLGPTPPHSGGHGGFHYAGQSNTSANPTTSSPRTQLRDHSVRWDWTCAFDVHMVKDDDGMLEPMPMTVVVKQFKAEENVTERVGVVKLDLAPFAGARSTTRRFLLQESKINSTVKVTIAMNLIKGDPMFKVPDLSPDLQIDLSRIAKGMMTSTSGVQNAAANITDAYSLRENDATSVYRLRATSMSDAAVAGVNNTKSTARSIMTLDQFDDPTTGSSSATTPLNAAPLPASGTLDRPVPVPIVVPLVPNADPRSPADVVAALFAQVVLAQKKQAPFHAKAHSDDTASGRSRGLSRLALAAVGARSEELLVGP
ncbi:hypothetical protein GGF32_009111 [Allomyces javanicus]|nr:hypothetical protein GGF32_009111 [Allomyces javanicus]